LNLDDGFMVVGVELNKRRLRDYVRTGEAEDPIRTLLLFAFFVASFMACFGVFWFFLFFWYLED
jgi:hypothetical protein